MFRVYGGPKVTCWLSGMKYLIVRLRIFSGIASYLNYPLTPKYRNVFDENIIGADANCYRAEVEAGARIDASTPHRPTPTLS